MRSRSLQSAPAGRLGPVQADVVQQPQDRGGRRAFPGHEDPTPLPGGVQGGPLPRVEPRARGAGRGSAAPAHRTVPEEARPVQFGEQ